MHFLLRSIFIFRRIQHNEKRKDVSFLPHRNIYNHIHKALLLLTCTYQVQIVLCVVLIK